MKNDRFPLKMAVFMAAYYITNSVYQGYMSLYYTSMRFTSGQIGMINACVALSSLAGQPLWGTLGDRSASRRRLIALLAFILGAIAVTFSMAARFLPLIVMAGLFAFFYTAIQPMGDSVILKELNESGRPFGPLRLCGCAAFALSGLVFGRITDTREDLIPLITAVLCAFTALSAFALPVSPGGQSKGRRMAFRSLVKHRDLIRLLLLMAPVQITMGYFYTFFSPHLMSLEGANGKALGICYLISAASEVPFLIMADRLFERFGAGKLMCSAALSLTIRWLILATGKTVGTAMFSQIFHGWGFIVMTVCMAKFISRTVPEGLQASGQMLLAIVSFGFARTVGNLGGGFLADIMGRQRVFFLCAGVCLGTLTVFAPVYLRRPPLNGANQTGNSAD